MLVTNISSFVSIFQSIQTYFSIWSKFPEKTAIYSSLKKYIFDQNVKLVFDTTSFLSKSQSNESEKKAKRNRCSIFYIKLIQSINLLIQL